MNRTVIPMLCVLCCLPPIHATADDIAMVEPFIGQSTFLVVKIDPTRISLPDLPDTQESADPGDKEAFGVSLREMAEEIETLRAATGGQTVYATVGIPLSETERPVFLFLKETPNADRELLFKHLNTVQEMESCVRDGLIVATPGRRTDVAAAVDAIVPSPREALANAFEAVREYPIQVLLLPPDYVRRTMIELMPELPRQLGGGPSNVLTEGLVWASLGVDVARLRAELVIQSRSEEAARDLAAHLPKLLKNAHESLTETRTRIPHEILGALSPLVKPRVDGDRIIVRLAGPESLGQNMRLVMMAADDIQERIRRRVNFDSFKEIGLAMQNHESAHGLFPPRDEDRDDKGNSRLSWRVHLLPYSGQNNGQYYDLYREFHLDEPWDSPHNKQFIERMPKIYKSHWFSVKPGHTTFLAPVGDDTIFGGQKATRYPDITDGSSRTVLLVEVEPSLAVPWTAPVDYAFDPEAPGRGLQIGTDGRFLAGFADGNVQRLRGNIEPEMLRRLFQKSDGKSVNPSTLR